MGLSFTKSVGPGGPEIRIIKRFGEGRGSKWSEGEPETVDEGDKGHWDKRHQGKPVRTDLTENNEREEISQP